MIHFLKIRPFTSPLCPLFLIPGKLPLSKTWFNHHLKQILIKSNLSPERYSAHSFRIGAATSAANQGISSSSLQQMGRWSSSAFTSYIRPDINTVLSNQRSLKPWCRKVMHITGGGCIICSLFWVVLDIQITSHLNTHLGTLLSHCLRGLSDPAWSEGSHTCFATYACTLYLLSVQRTLISVCHAT